MVTMVPRLSVKFHPQCTVRNSSDHSGRMYPGKHLTVRGPFLRALPLLDIEVLVRENPQTKFSQQGLRGV